MKYKSFAKINLCLDVIKRRDDGYHELDMVMVPIDLFDTLSIKVSEKMELRTDKGFLPIDERNTIIKAINVLREEYKFTENFSIKLVKNIPTQSGMGGGSSNAATVIKMVNKLLDLQMSDAKMYELGEAVGADVPFCLYGKPAHVSGIGDILAPIDFNLEMFVFLVKPKWGVSTPQAYNQLDLDNLYHPNCKDVIKGINENNYELFVNNLGNSLEVGAFDLVSEIKILKEELIAFGFDSAIMSGSGSTVFAITQDEELVNKAVTYFVRKYPFVKKSKIITDIEPKEDISHF